MRYLLLGARLLPTPQVVGQVRSLVPITDEDQVRVISVHRPRKRHRLDVEAHWAVDPSVVPWRPLSAVPTTRRSRKDTGPVPPGERIFARWRRLTKAVPTIPRMRWSARTQFAVACATNRRIRRIAQESDVVVALDSDAIYGAWILSKRIPGLIAVNGAPNVQGVLARRGPEVFRNGSRP